jgi:hypothetical protein
MGRSKLTLILLTIVVVAIIATVGVVVPGGGTQTIDVGSVAGSPEDWAGEQVTVEGVVGLTMDYMFVLCDENYESNIMVKWASASAMGEGARVAVTGYIITEEPYGRERVYLVASELRYLD